MRLMLQVIRSLLIGELTERQKDLIAAEINREAAIIVAERSKKALDDALHKNEEKRAEVIETLVKRLDAELKGE